ncbi:MAG: nitroreductase family protein [Lachnospiraceae bacterium]|nr:nitroreductase family protein [Lachnospiraceae bacterium]
MLKELVSKCRSYRRFYQEERIGEETLRELADLARMTASTANSQALKYRLVYTEEECAGLFPCINWAGALPDWPGPAEGERPSGYIVICCDLALGKNKMWDNGITAQTMMLGAVEKGFGGCMIGSFQRSEAAAVLGIDQEKYSIDLILALGKPKEEVVVVPMKEDGDVRYYRDENQVHYVPKRALEDVIL